MKAGRLALLACVFAAIPCLVACPSKEGLSSAGEECFAASDCAPGLICVLQRNGARLCSDDLTLVAGRPAAGGPADAGDAGDASPDGAAEDGATLETDADVVDTGSESGLDSGLPDAPIVDASDAG